MLERWPVFASAAAEFTGKERDSETGLDYFGARYLSSAQGRFTTPGPLGASGKASNPQTWTCQQSCKSDPIAIIKNCPPPLRLGALSLLSVFTGAIAEYKQAQVTGVFTTIFGENKILDPTKAAENLGTGTIIQYTDKAGKSQFYTVRNGQFVRGGCNQKKENCGIPYPSEGSFTVVDLQ